MMTSLIPLLLNTTALLALLKPLSTWVPYNTHNERAVFPSTPRDKLVELQEKFDELEQCQVFCRPEDVGITVEYLNPSSLSRSLQADLVLLPPLPMSVDTANLNPR